MKRSFDWKCPTIAMYLLVALQGYGQDFQLRASIDSRLTYLQSANKSSLIRTYDAFGRISDFTLSLVTETGLQLKVAQKLELLPGDADSDPLDYYYAENPGVWRIGKQYYHFGSGQILRESVLAVRSDQTISEFDLPVIFTAFSGARGHQRGAMIRIGDNYGISFAVGAHLGISGTALGLVRRPEDASGVGAGWSQAYGADWKHTDGAFQFSAEYVGLRNGHLGRDPNDDIFDALVHYRASEAQQFEFGITHDNAQSADFYRFRGFFQAGPTVQVIPMIRVRNGNLYDLSITFQFKL